MPQQADVQSLDYLTKMTMGWTYAALVPFFNLLVIVAGFFSISIEVFIRHSFGERYFGIFRYLIGGLFLSLFVLGGQLIGWLNTAAVDSWFGQAQGWLTITVLQLIYWSYLIVGLVHLSLSWYRRNFTDSPWHSWSFGVSWFNFLVGRKFFVWTVTDWMLYRFVEPMFFFALAILAAIPMPGVSLFLFLVGMILFTKNNYLYLQARGKVLDLLDAQIEASFVEQATSGDDKRKTAGFSMVRSPARVDWNNDGIPDILQTSSQDDNAIDTTSTTMEREKNV